MKFNEFPKMARLSRECVVTEKIDGTNASVLICKEIRDYDKNLLIASFADTMVFAGSRTRYVTPSDDNFGWAAWVKEHAEELTELGEGQHFGEWWGKGIQRNYGLAERRFSLFNTLRWTKGDPIEIKPTNPKDKPKLIVNPPACCDVVPTLYKGDFNTNEIEHCLYILKTEGSLAAPGFMNPEGVVVYHVAGNVGFKKTLGGDGAKGANRGGLYHSELGIIFGISRSRVTTILGMKAR